MYKKNQVDTHSLSHAHNPRDVLYALIPPPLRPILMRCTFVLEADTGEIESDTRMDKGLLTTQNLHSQIGLCAPE